SLLFLTFFFTDPAPTEIYTLSLHDALPIFFFSARPGTVGSSDIWAAWRADVHDDFAWQTPANLGTGVNTTGFEGGPGYFENEDGAGAQLFFNRNPAPVGNGGDIYVSMQAEDGTWGTAVPVAELNSAASDQRP